MDPVTHALTGTLIAEAGFRQRLGGHSAVALTLVSMFPDIDIVYRMAGLPTYILHHRAISHSFVGIVFTGVLLGGLFGRLDEERRYLPWMAACWVALFSHQILDLITSYGTVLLYPFNNTRYYFDWVFIIDLFLTVILLVFVILARLRRESGERRAKTGLALAAGYIAFCALNHTFALHQLAQSAAENTIAYQNIAAIPQPLSPTRWAGIIDAGSDYYRVPLQSFRRPQVADYQPFTKTSGSLYERKARSSEMGVLYLWFARYPVVQEKLEGSAHILEFYDLRFYRAPLFRYVLRTPFVLRIKMDDSGNILESRFSRS